MSNLAGGIDTGSAYLGAIGLSYAYQSERHGFFASLLANGGDSAVALVGDFQATSNIDAESSAKVYELWYQYAFSENLTALFGLHDYNATFYSLESAAVFLNASFGLGADVAQVSPSTYNTTALGLVVEANLGRQYLLLASYDGVPGSPTNADGTHFHFDDTDGLFSSAEYGFSSDQGSPVKLAAGVWYHTRETENPISGELMNNNRGAYFIGETDFARNWNTFFQYGITESEKNLVENYLGLGVTRSAIFSAGDQFGIALARVTASGASNSQVSELGKSETVFEFTYYYEFDNGIALQPDLQWVMQPGLDPSIDDAMVFTLRFNYAL